MNLGKKGMVAIVIMVLCGYGYAIGDGRSLEVKMEKAELHGDLASLMYFYVDVYVGTFNSGPSKQSLIIDTGSSITLFPCQKHWPDWGLHLNDHYPVDMSSTSEIVGYDNSRWISPKNLTEEDPSDCRFHQSYKEGSAYEGFYVTDYIELSDTETHDVSKTHTATFGCVTKETGYFKTQLADGIMGLARGNHRQHFPTVNKEFQMDETTDSSMFSLCLGHDTGVITFGGYDEELKYADDDIIQWFPLISEYSYKIELDKLYIGNVHVPHVPRVGLIDSGSSWVVTSHEESEHIDQAMNQYCNSDSDEERCIGKSLPNEPKWFVYDVTRNTSIRTWMASFPTITFTTSSGGKLHWYPSEYFELRKNTSTYCIQLVSYPNIHETVLGASFLKQNVVIFDADAGQVAFMRARCQSDPNRVTTLSFEQTLGMAIEECQSCDIMQEEVNMILFVAVGLLVVMLLAVAIIVGTYLVKNLKYGSSKVDYAPYSEEHHDVSNDSTEMDRVGFMHRVDEDDF